MKREDLSDLLAFVEVAREKSFTRAAARLGVSQSTLSNTVKALEARIGVTLLARTTRSVSTTEAGQRLFDTVQPAIERIGAEIQGLGELQAGLRGTLRITATRHAASSVLLPVLVPLLRAHPGLAVEVDSNDAFTDIVANRFDAGIRFGEHVERDMIAVPVGPPIRAAIVASPSYFEQHPRPRKPSELSQQNCIGYRLASAGHLYRWQFNRQNRPVEVTVKGTLIVNEADILVQSALDGLGIAFVFEHMVTEHLRTGALVRVLKDWCPSLPGYYLYYPKRRKTAALATLIDAMRAALRGTTGEGLA